ncbi:MAG: prohibitin family protein [Candidatus Dojkabacteria bacterium]
MLDTLRSRLRKGVVVVLAIVLFVFIFFISALYTIVNAGEVGVVSTFGNVSENALQPGFHLKNPFSQIIKMNTRTASYTMSGSYAEGEIQGDDSIQALAKDGGLVWFDVTVLYRLKTEAAPEVYKSLGIAYQENIIRPEIRSTIREVAAQFPVNELYSSKREEAQNTILERLVDNVSERGIVIEDVLLRRVNISESLSDSIERKLAAEQAVEQQKFEIQKAKKEAERKVVEAKGQRDAQRIVNQSLTNKYLYFLYVNNLENREGTIYVPVNPDNGLPLFRNLE